MRSNTLRVAIFTFIAALCVPAFFANPANSQDAPAVAPGDAAPSDKEAAEDAPPPKSPTDPTAQLKRLMPKYDVFIDAKNKQVVMEGEVCLTKGVLEMFACLKGTKEHESVVAIHTKAFVVHAALLALGAEPGKPAKFLPNYTPASGPKVGVEIFWTDEKGARRRAKAQDWVRDQKTKKAMTYDWVFAGSGFYVDEETKRQFYQADSGDFICVSNFPSAMLDIPVESSSENDSLMFEALTENIPAKGTKVMVVLTPEIKPAAGAKKAAK